MPNLQMLSCKSIMSHANRYQPRDAPSFVLLAVGRRIVLLIALLFLHLANLALICKLAVDVGEDDVKDVLIPASRPTLDTLLDVLQLCPLAHACFWAMRSNLPRGAQASPTGCPPGR